MPRAGYYGQIVRDNGDIVASPTIEVRRLGSGLPLAQVFEERVGGSALGNPFVGEADGSFLFYVDLGGAFQIKATKIIGAETFEKIIPYVAIGVGETYDLIFTSSGMVGDGEAFPAVVVPAYLTLKAGLALSWVVADVAPLNSYTVTFQSKRGAGSWTTIFTATFTAGQKQAAITLADDVELVPGDLIRPVGAATHDPNLQGLTATIVADR